MSLNSVVLVKFRVNDGTNYEVTIPAKINDTVCIFIAILPIDVLILILTVLDSGIETTIRFSLQNTNKEPKIFV